MKPHTILLITGAALAVFAAGFFCFALSRPMTTAPWQPYVTNIIVAVYLAATVAAFAASAVLKILSVARGGKK